MNKKLKDFEDTFEIFYDTTTRPHFYLRKKSNGLDPVALFNAVFPGISIEDAIKMAKENEIELDYVGMVTDDDIKNAEEICALFKQELL